VPSSELPLETGAFVGAGQWRAALANGKSDWPASWTSMERAKFLSRDGRCLYKFEGLGHYGLAVHARALALQEAGFSSYVSAPLDSTGYLAYSRVFGRNLHGTPATQQLIDSIARYCALRARLFAAPDAQQCESNRQNLQLMLLTNFSEEFGSAAEPVHGLEIERPVIADGRMQPWEWARDGENLIKFDAVSHGDDHFFPGPTDIAWDLAGAVVEFAVHGRNESLAGPILEKYREYSGDDARSRLPAYLLAYSAFRLGYCKMAAEAMSGSEEEPRLGREYLLYRDFAAEFLANRSLFLTSRA
jgi:hypothetical protein